MKLKIIQPKVENLEEKKDFLLNESKTFCMYPWISLHINPIGQPSPCCISNPLSDFGSTASQSLSESVNHPNMKRLRVDLLNDIKNDVCISCYRHEDSNIRSARIDVNERYKHFFDTDVASTKEDGHLDDFKMRYYDIRFGNLCNFKCRTCGPAYSSQWEAELVKTNSMPPIPFKTPSRILPEVIEHIPNMMEAYFAGGEPLIAEEHYLLLEEMLRQGRNDIKLQYNSNISNLKYKNKDLIDLWSHFTQSVSICASVDHFGERAEYIRHGTDWGVIETNVEKLRRVGNVNLTMNTVFSVFNAMTIQDFYSYLYSKGWLNSGYQLYPMSSPPELSSTILPKHKKEIATNNFYQYIDYLKKLASTPSSYLTMDTTAESGTLYWMMSVCSWMNSKDNWEEQKEQFRKTIQTIDYVRGESFVKVFPELADMMED